MTWRWITNIYNHICIVYRIYKTIWMLYNQGIDFVEYLNYILIKLIKGQTHADSDLQMTQWDTYDLHIFKGDPVILWIVIYMHILIAIYSNYKNGMTALSSYIELKMGWVDLQYNYNTLLIQ